MRLNKDRLYFLGKDPHWAFVWWEIVPQTLEKARASLGGEAGRARFVLRVHDVTDIVFNGENAHSTYVIEVTGETDHWYLHIPVANRNYCVEAGLEVDGRFSRILLSNILSLPPDRPSDLAQEEWSTIEIGVRGK